MRSQALLSASLATALLFAFSAPLSAEECPAGFEESEERCTDAERAEGCKDVRLDDGTGCVSRVDGEDADDDEECPDGFEESEERCSDEEREEGCRDLRLDNGTGCVSR